MSKEGLAAAKKEISLEQRVLRFIREHCLLSRGQKLVVAVSGGPDSVCLLHVLVGLQKGLGIRLHVAHLDHQLRGDESRSDADYVSDLADRLNIPVIVEQRDVKEYQRQHRLSLEEAAREVRYSFLAKVAESIGADRVAVGHTVDDHIETILMHLVRGSGINGLRGLQPLGRSSGLTVIRPLLEINRQETNEYCQHHQLTPRLDASNLSLSLLRNRIRLQLLPRLRSYNPRVAEALLRTARIASDNVAFLDGEMKRVWGEIEEKEGTIVLDKKRFMELPSALQRHLLRASIERLLGNLKDIEARHVEEIMDALDKPAGKSLSLPEGLRFIIEYDRYLIGSDPTALSPFPALEDEILLAVPGKTSLPGWRVEATVSHKRNPEEASLTACFDFDKVGDRLTMRQRRAGDRFQPLGMGQPKKLGEFMIDARIPKAWRQRIPVVGSPTQILWVVGWRIDERVKVTAGTKRVLCLNLARE